MQSIRMKNRIGKFLGCSALAASLVACGAGTPQESDLNIYGGVRTKPGEWLNTVAITNRFGTMFCSGTAITPRVIITAAHCIPSDGSPTNAKIHVGEGRDGGSVKAQYNVTRLAASPKYEDSDNDIGYMVTSKDLEIPASAYTPVLIKAEELSEAMQAGVMTKLVGFGQRESGQYGSKFEVDAPITKVNDNEVDIGGDGKDSCYGDSGGPAYVKLKNSEWRVFGIVSRGDECGTGGIYGRMDANICWVQQDSGMDLGLPAGTCP